MTLKLSIVIPTFNEMNNEFFKKTIMTHSQNSLCEIYVVDRFSNDGTVEFLSQYKVNIIQTKHNSRAARINIGIESSKTELIVLNHPRSFIEPEGISHLMSCREVITWGAFTHKFDLEHPVLNFTSWYSNHIRGDIRKIYYLDHCIYFSKKKVGDIRVPDVDIFEDTLLCQKLSAYGIGTRISFLSTSSSIRFVKNGILKQVLLNQLMKLAFIFKVPHKYMNKIYEKGLSLNSKY